MEHNTVRFVDNFSGGNRGAASTEYFLDNGYAVIFMHRLKSLEPFTRHFNGQKFMDMLDLNDKGPHMTITGESCFSYWTWWSQLILIYYLVIYLVFYNHWWVMICFKDLPLVGELNELFSFKIKFIVNTCAVTKWKSSY